MSDVGDLLMQDAPSRYLVGIDLGTTNCAVAYVDTEQATPSVIHFKVKQWVDWQTSEERDTLPSFTYQWTVDELGEQAERRSGKIVPKRTVGVWARERGGLMPGRQIGSAKSWLCHEGVDRTAPLLPWHADEDVEKISPVQASSLYLAQIVKDWDERFPTHPLAQQEVIITLPASFDEVARELTVQAAQMAGLKRVFLIEEPQAAFYAWLHRNREQWDKIIRAGQTILVCDIGGGTTDFTLIRVRESQGHKDNAMVDQAIASTITLHRVAVGQHLILGGDNFDLTLARFLEQRIASGKQLPHRQWEALRQRCRTAKEVLLGANAPENYTIHLPGSGARLLAAGTQVEVSQQDIQQVLIQGFLPEVEFGSRPSTVASGFVEFGLPYASDAAITKHLSSFLQDHAWAGRGDEERHQFDDSAAARPDWILFNGGVLESDVVSRTIVRVVSSWFAGKVPGAAADWQPGVLEAPRKDLAVAEGAAYFGLVRRGLGIRIDARLARSYYLAVSKQPPKAICLVPGEASPGEQFVLADKSLELAVGVPVEFPVYVSSLRLADPVGSIVEVDSAQMHSLPPIRTVIDTGKGRQKSLERVQLEAELSEIGTLQLSCVAVESKKRWKLEFDIRSSLESGRDANIGGGESSGIVDDALLRVAQGAIEETFVAGTLAPSKLVKELRQRLELDRSQWPPSLLRGMWQQLIDVEEGRRRSAEHESRWLNLLGYCLRPGYGMAADDWRVTECWRRIHGKLAFPALSSRQEAIVLWRRISGGFTAGQQLALWQALQGSIKEQIANRGKAIRTGASELIELIRLVGSLELLPLAEKVRLVELLTEVVRDKKSQPLHAGAWWSIGRIVARVPMYGPLSGVVDAIRIERWLDIWLMLPVTANDMMLAVMQAARRTGDRYRDISEDARGEVLRWMENSNAPAHYLQLVREVGQLADQEQQDIFGESLPLGLRFASE